MRVLFVTPTFPPFPGGGERFAHSLALQLSQRDHEIEVITSAARREHELWLGSGRAEGTHAATDFLPDADLSIKRLATRPVPGGWRGLRLWRAAMVLLSALPGNQAALLERMATWVPPIPDLALTVAAAPACDLIHAFNISWEHALLAAWKVARQRQIPFVVTPFTHLGAAGRGRVARNSTMDHQRRLLADAEAVLALTAVERDGLAQLGIARERILVIGAGLDPLPPVTDYAGRRRRLGVTAQYVLFLGRASFEKGAIHTMRAVAALRRQGHPITLVLAGQTTTEFERALARWPAHDSEAIRPLGLVDEADKHALLEGAVALALPSRTDSLGIVLLEAWAHATPVIGASAGGIPGVVDHGHNGFLVDFGDVPALTEAILRLLTDEELRRTVGQHGQASVAAQYTWEQVGHRVHNCYLDLRPDLA